MENATATSQNEDLEGPAARLARRAVAARATGASDEVARLIAAGRDAMARAGVRSRPRVADIVAAAGLSNDAFYRHFGSKDHLVAAILEDGTERLCSYLAHQMAKAETPEEQVRAWVEGILAQADDEAASTTLAVLWNASSVAAGPATARPSPSEPLGRLLVAPLSALGVADVPLRATLLAHALVGRLSDHLWGATRADAAEVDAVVALCLAGVRPSASGRRRRG